MSGLVSIVPPMIRTDGAATTHGSVQSAIDNLAAQVQNAINGVTGGWSSPQILAQSGVPATVTGTLTQTVLATIPIPANALGPNGALRIKFSAQATNNTNNKTITVALAGVSAWGISTGASTAGTIESGLEIKNVGVQNSQIWTRTNASPWTSTATGSLPVSSVNMAAAQVLTIMGTLAVSTDYLTLATYTVELLNP